MNVILGLDPGSEVTGYGILRQDGCKLHYLGSGCISNKLISTFSDRLKNIYTEVNNLISKKNPDCIAIEQVFVSKNYESAIKLGQARGVAIIAAINLNLPIFEYTACQIKKSVVGIGSAAKKQVIYMVRNILQLPFNPSEDAADALAIAITHSHIRLVKIPYL